MSRRPVKPHVKARGSTAGLREELTGLSAGEAGGIPGVAVKCVDIRKNTSGEGGLLDCELTLSHESVGSEQD